jgi:hypothetical protein
MHADVAANVDVLPHRRPPSPLTFQLILPLHHSHTHSIA